MKIQKDKEYQKQFTLLRRGMQQQALVHITQFPASVWAAAGRPSCSIQCSSRSSCGYLLFGYGHIARHLQRASGIGERIRLSRRRDYVAAAASSESQANKSTSKWLLEPAGDGDCRHLGVAIPLPSAFELSSDAATVGRVADKADIVIPVGTVSGIHARLEKKESVLMVTDLDSTNGTYIDNKRLRPGAVTPARPGSSITFGDEHLAQFRFSIVEESDETAQGE